MSSHIPYCSSELYDYPITGAGIQIKTSYNQHFLYPVQPPKVILLVSFRRLEIGGLLLLNLAVTPSSAEQALLRGPLFLNTLHVCTTLVLLAQTKLECRATAPRELAAHTAQFPAEAAAARELFPAGRCES